MIPIKIFDLNLLKSSADWHREQIPENNFFGIGELLNKPVFFDWVDCRLKENIHFQMFLAGADDGVAMRFFWNGSYEKTTLSLWGEFAKKMV
jgi:hypothetical protein